MMSALTFVGPPTSALARRVARLPAAVAQLIVVKKYPACLHRCKGCTVIFLVIFLVIHTTRRRPFSWLVTSFGCKPVLFSLGRFSYSSWWVTCLFLLSHACKFFIGVSIFQFSQLLSVRTISSLSCGSLLRVDITNPAENIGFPHCKQRLVISPDGLIEFLNF